MQDNLRERLITFLAETGIKQKFVSDKVKIPTPALSRFKSSQLDLTRSSFDDLDKFLKNQGY